eukprot:CAMPEP_0170540138 /NCGR_PEP_ID=MMETSP0211-20121228/157_1 /TAXON_ID=311385 /ORGANISM="Pseudokeronopsis sp., Strain OXSARD2" /LENGTH=323 /DNA_ID=CAMNT_0010842427 /DNA_START=24 /DNA_END=995 /DNA_ORIENTATION=-
MRTLLIVAALALANATAFTEAEREFIEFMVKHKRSYGTKEEYNFRLDIFKQKYDEIKKHNQENTSFTMGVNMFSDMTDAEFSQRLGFLGTTNRVRDEATFTNSVGASDFKDWVEEGAVAYVKDQGSCGSCWSFSATGALEGEHFLTNKKMEIFSEQELLDCDSSLFTNHGCNGGLMDYAFEYAMENKMTRESEYPYEEDDSGACRASKHEGVFSIGGYKDVKAGSEQDLLEALAVRPVSVAIQANQLAFQGYKSGIIDAKCGNRLDHGVLLAVGYGTDNGQKYYKVKNSWGPKWGEDGYVRIARNGDGDGMCGIQMQASFPYA